MKIKFLLTLIVGAAAVCFKELALFIARQRNALFPSRLGSSIGGLLLASGPCDIRRFVMTVIVDPIDRVCGRWLRAESRAVFIERRKAEFNAAATVTEIRLRAWISASIFGGDIAPIELASIVPYSTTMHGVELRSQTTTTLAPSSEQLPMPNYFYGSTIALARPFHAPVISAQPVRNRPESKPTTIGIAGDVWESVRLMFSRTHSKPLYYLILCIGILAIPAQSQNARYDQPFPSISNTFPYYLEANVFPNSPTIAVCHSPANQVPCTNYVTTFDSTGAACPNGSQDTPQPQPSACQPTGDAEGNIGFWAPVGTYDYTVCIQNNCFGPYTITLGGGGASGTITAAAQFKIAYYCAPGVSNIICGGQASDDQINPFISPDGFSVGTNGAYTYQVANDTVTGTTNLTAACNNGSQQAIICPSASSTTNTPIGFTVKNGGTTGNATVGALGWLSVLVDNSATSGHWAVGSTTTDGYLHDTGSTARPNGQAAFYVFSSNAGVGTPAVIELLTPEELGAASGGTNCPFTTLGDLCYGGVSGTPTRLPGPTGPNNVPQIPFNTPSGGAATAWQLGPSGVPTRASTCGSNVDTILATDRAHYVSWTDASACTVTLPQANSTGFASNFVFVGCNIGAGTVTVTPTTSTVSYSTGAGYTSGAANLPLKQGQCAFFYSDNTNYFAFTNARNPVECIAGLGDGANAIPAVTYPQYNCANKSSIPWTITGISCFTDNAGSSTLSAANNAGTALLTGAITCNNTKTGGGQAGTQSGTVTLPVGDAINFSFVADGTSTQTTWTVTFLK